MEIKYINDSKTTIINEKNGVPYITFPKLEQYKIKHGFSTRLGGVSKDFLGTMNLSFQRNDDEKLVKENHERFASAIGYEAHNLVFSDQVHLTNIKKVTRDDIGKGISKTSDIKEVDGLVTDVMGIPLIAFFADCVPLFFYDPIAKVVGLAHAGWRGTVGRIGSKMVEYMQEEYGSRPADIIVAIGPSICQQCYEIGEDVANEFEHIFSKEQYNDFIIDKGNGKYELDLHKANKYILMDSGIREDNVDVTDMCTCCNPEFLFSHRASKGKRGNLAAVITL